VELRAFANANFAFGSLFSFVLGLGLYGSVYLVPLFLGRVRGYDSLQIGTTVFVTGIAQILSVVVAARLSQRLDPRWMITAGLSLFASSLWATSYLTPEWGFWSLALPQALRGFAIMLCIVPSVTLALSGFAAAELRYASGLFNLMRNLGGAIGIAVVTTWLQDYARIDTLRIGESLGEAGRIAPDVIATLAARIGETGADAAHSLLMAQGELARFVARNALTLSFNDVFRLMAWVFAAALLMVPFCRPMLLTAAQPVESH